MSAEHGSYTCVARREIDRLGGLVNIEGLARRWGVSKSTAWSHTRGAEFPAPVTYEGRSGPVKVWFAVEADAYRERHRA